MSERFALGPQTTRRVLELTSQQRSVPSTLPAPRRSPQKVGGGGKVLIGRYTLNAAMSPTGADADIAVYGGDNEAGVTLLDDVGTAAHQITGDFGIAAKANDGSWYVVEPGCDFTAPSPPPYEHPDHVGHVTSSGDGATTIAPSVVTSAMMVDTGVVAGTYPIATVEVDAAGRVLTITAGTAYSHPNHTGHVHSSGDGATTIQPGVVSSAMMVATGVAAGSYPLATVEVDSAGRVVSISAGSVSGYTHPNHTGHVHSAGDGATTIQADVVTSAMMVDTGVVAGTYAIATVEVDAAGRVLSISAGTAYTHPNHTGDVTSVGDGATTIAANAVTNAKAADMPAQSVKWNATGATANPADGTVAAGTVLGRTRSGNLDAMTPEDGRDTLRGALQTLTSGTTVTFDPANGIHFKLTASHNFTLGFPTSPKVGETVFIYVIQDGTGGRTITLASGYEGVAPITLSTAAGAKDRLELFFDSATTCTVTITPNIVDI